MYIYSIVIMQYYVYIFNSNYAINDVNSYSGMIINILTSSLYTCLLQQIYIIKNAIIAITQKLI